jgi:beta-lactamase superfamily II metal-dependent hydrolase
VRAPGEPCLLFDAGSRDRPRLYREALAPLLARWEVARPRIALSHDDRDHASAFERLALRYAPRSWIGALPPALAAKLPRDCARVDPEGGAVRLDAGGGPLRLSLFRALAMDGNEGSRTLSIELDRTRVLLFGDAEAEGLGALLDSDWLPGRDAPTRVVPVRLLLFPHHGSDTPWLGELLRRTQPREVWISAPSEPAVAAELDRRRLDWSWTGRDGPLRLRMRPERPSRTENP